MSRTCAIPISHSYVFLVTIACILCFHLIHLLVYFHSGYGYKRSNGESINDLLDDTKRVKFHQSYLTYLANAIRYAYCKLVNLKKFELNMMCIFINFVWSQTRSRCSGLFHMVSDG